jgi:hypothetical protein
MSPLTGGLQCRQFFLASDERKIFVGGVHDSMPSHRVRTLKLQLGDRCEEADMIARMNLSHFQHQIPCLRGTFDESCATGRRWSRFLAA